MKELELLAGAVAGRGIALERGGAGMYSDGSTIFLGSEIDEDSDEARRGVLAQAALIASGSLQRDRMLRLSRSSHSSSRRYLALEVVRAAAELDPLLPRGFQGAVSAYAVRVGVSQSSEDSLRRALGGARLDEPPPWFGDLRPLRVLRTSGGSGGETASDAELAKALRKATEETDSEDDDTNDGERSRIMELLSSPIKNPLGSALQRMLGAKRSSGEGAGGAEINLIEHRSGTPSRGARRAPAMEPFVTVGGQLTRGAHYPEWDHRTARYREDWCTVGELDPPRDEEASPPPAVADPKLTRELSRLGLTWRPHDGEMLGDELDLTALVDYRVGVRAGTATEPKVYRAERRTAQELGALVLLDATGSTAEQADGRAMFDEQQLLAHGLTTALDQLGVRVATYAFYSRGRGNVRFLRCKAFEERWGLAAQRRLFSVGPSGFTRLGAAIRHAGHLLDTQAGTQRRLLIVIGDGIAYDDGYEGRYAVEDCRRAIEEATARAIGCVGISTRTVDAEAIWPADAHRVATSASELGQDARELFGAALRRAGRGASSNARTFSAAGHQAMPER